MLQTHRNFEWAIKYLLIESQDYAQLMTPGEPERALGPTLLWLLKQCSHIAPFRQKVLHAALSANKLPAHSNNILVLLSMCIQSDDDKAVACELDVLPQLTSCIELPTSANSLDIRQWVHVDEALQIFSRVCEWCARKLHNACV